MDQRVREHAETLVDWSARIEPGDDVVVQVAEGAHDLAVAVAERLGERGANLVATYAADEVSRAYLRAHDGEFDPDPAYERELYERADAVLILGGGRNTAALADVPGDRRTAASRARQGIREARLATDWVSTVHPTRSLAQQAGMAYRPYREFVYDAVLRDWASLAEEMARLKRLLDDGSEVRIVAPEPRGDGGRDGAHDGSHDDGEDSGDDGDRDAGSDRGDGDPTTDPATDLTLTIENRRAVNSAASVAYDSHNLPSGEVFTAPAGAEGRALFDVPMTIGGRRVRDVRLTFEDGEVVDWSAGAGEASIRETLATDDGARRLGELGIGMNRGIDRPTDNVLFDEKMAGTVHLALGRAYDACLPEGEAGNDSAVHVDLVARMGEGSRLEIDGEVVQRDGVFRWEDGFE